MMMILIFYVPINTYDEFIHGYILPLNLAYKTIGQPFYFVSLFKKIVKLAIFEQIIFNYGWLLIGYDVKTLTTTDLLEFSNKAVLTITIKGSDVIVIINLQLFLSFENVIYMLYL